MSRNLFPLSVVATLLAGTALADVPRVAADIAPVHSLVARVMQGVGEPSLIVAAGASPHEYSLRPSEASALQDANLVFWVSPDLTPWLEGAIETLAVGATVTELLESNGTLELPLRESALFEAHSHDHGTRADKGHADKEHADKGHADKGRVDKKHGDKGHADKGRADKKHGDKGHADKERADKKHGDKGHADKERADKGHGKDHVGHGDEGRGKHADREKHDGHKKHADHADHEHGAHNPHAWLSPDNGAVWLNTIAAHLSVVDPENAGAYFANAAAGREELAALSTEINSILDPVRGSNFIVFHDAYQYFEAAFDFPASGVISVSDASDPSPARIAEIQVRVADQGISCVLSEPQFNPGIVAAVMEGSEARTGVLDPLGADIALGPDLYGNVLRNLAKALAGCL